MMLQGPGDAQEGCFGTLDLIAAAFIGVASISNENSKRKGDAAGLDEGWSHKCFSSCGDPAPATVTGEFRLRNQDS
jgi:hypothetical protein